MPNYKIACPKTDEPREVFVFLNELVEDGGESYVPCDHPACRGENHRQYITTPMVNLDGYRADADPFKVKGLEGAFDSYKGAQRAADNQGKSLMNTTDSMWTGHKDYAMNEKVEMLKEMGYSSVADYNAKRRNDAHRLEKSNETRERKNIKRK